MKDYELKCDANSISQCKFIGVISPTITSLKQSRKINFNSIYLKVIISACFLLSCYSVFSLAVSGSKPLMGAAVISQLFIWMSVSFYKVHYFYCRQHQLCPEKFIRCFQMSRDLLHHISECWKAPGSFSRSGTATKLQHKARQRQQWLKTVICWIILLPEESSDRG